MRPRVLIATAKTYLAALAAHDPAKAPLASNVKLVENAEPIEAGEGLWKTASSVPGDFAHHAAVYVMQRLERLPEIAARQRAQVGA